MIYQLVKRDQAWKLAPWFALVFAAGALFAENARSIAIMPLAMASVAAMTAAAQTQERTTGFLKALPIARREIFLSRVYALMILVWIPVLVAAGVCAVIGSYGAKAFIAIGAIAMPMALGYQSLAIREIRFPAWVTTIAVASVVGWMCVAMALFPEGIRIPLAPVLGASGLVSAWVFISVWYAIPRFREAPAAKWSGSVFARSKVSRGFPWWLFSWWDLVWFAVLFNLTFTSSWPSALLFLVMGPMQTRERLRWLDPLPFRRRLILAARLAPSLLALAGGYLVGIHLGMAGGWVGVPNRVLITRSREWPPRRETSSCAALNVAPPIDYWRPAGDGVPMIQAPWGETYQPPVVRVWRSDVYNPYGVGCENTKRFLEWQYERASLAAYGQLIPSGEAHVRAVPRLRTQILNVGMMLACGLLVMFPVMLADWWRVRRLPKWLRYGLAGMVAVVFFGVALGPIVFPGFRNIVGAPREAAQWISWWMPDGLTTVVIAAASVPLMIYGVIEKVFLGSEWTAWGPRA